MILKNARLVKLSFHRTPDSASNQKMVGKEAEFYFNKSHAFDRPPD
jgi:hypothetical protein